MQGGEDLHPPYPWLMRNSITVRGRRITRWGRRPTDRTVKSRLLDPTETDVAEFAPDEANEAVAHAAAEGGAFRTAGAPAQSGDDLPMRAGRSGAWAWSLARPSRLFMGHFMRVYY